MNYTTDLDGNKCFVNKERETVFEFLELFMVDGEGKRSDNVRCKMEKSDNGLLFKIIPDYDFLNSDSTIFPVVLDPTIMVTGSSSTFDTCVDEQYPNSNYYLAQSLWTGGKTETNTMRTYIKFSLPSNVSSANVTSAYIRIKKREHKTPTVKAYRVTSNWSSNSVTWNNKPSFSSSNPTSTIVLDTGSWYKINCTEMVKKWLDGNYNNYGFLLKESSETNGSQKTKYYSSDAPSPNKPELVINYSSGTSGEKPTVRLKHYTDEGYRARFPNYAYSVNSYHNTVKNKLESFFNVKIVSNFYNTYSSYCDICKHSLPGQFSNNLSVACPHSPDHLNRTNVKNRFVSDYGNGSPTVWKYLWTGHILTQNAGSAAWVGNKVVMITPANTTNNSYVNLSDTLVRKNSIYTLMHETSHLFSAEDHYCYQDNGNNPCSNPFCIMCKPTPINNINCIMLTRIYSIESLYNVNDVYCSKCIWLITNHVGFLS